MDTAVPTTPTAPTGATPVNVGPTIVVTATTDPGGAVASGVDHYDVYRDGVKVNVSAIPEVGPHGWSDVAGQSTSPASGSHSYSYTVVAIDAAGNASAQSAARVILMDSAAPTTPAAPTGLSPVSAAPTITVTTTTDPGGGLASGVDHYDVYRDGSKVNVSAIPAGGPYAWSDVAGQSSTPASGAHAYLYTVVAVDAAGNPSAQSPSHTIVLDPGAVSAPTSVTAVATPTSQAPQVSWGAPTRCALHRAPLQRLSRRSRHAGRSRHRRHDVHRYHAEPARRQLHLPGGRRRRRRHHTASRPGRSPSSWTTHAARGAGRCRCQRRARRLHRHHVGRARATARLGRSPLRRAPLALVDAAGVRLPMATRPARSRRLRAPTRRR